MTMTVAELISELQKYNQSLPVLASWESVGAGILPENLEITEHDGRNELIIDVNMYG